MSSVSVCCFLSPVAMPSSLNIFTQTLVSLVWNFHFIRWYKEWSPVIALSRLALSSLSMTFLNVPMFCAVWGGGLRPSPSLTPVRFSIHVPHSGNWRLGKTCFPLRSVSSFIKSHTSPPRQPGCFYCFYCGSIVHSINLTFKKSIQNTCSSLLLQALFAKYWKQAKCP